MAKIKMTRNDVLVMEAGLKKAKLTGHLFTYSVTKNKQVVVPEAKAIRAAMEPGEDYLKYLKALEELNVKLANKDPKGVPMKFQTGPGRFVYDIPGLGVDDSPYGKRIATLKEEHKKALEEQEKKEKEDVEFLGEEVSLDLITIRINRVPKDVSQEVMDGLIFMLKPVSEKELDDDTI